MNRKPAASTRASRAKRLQAIRQHPSNQDRIRRQTATAVRAQIQNRAFGRPAIVSFIGGSRVRADVRFAGSMLAAYFAVPDWEEMNVWKKELKRGDLFVDVGANVGLYSVLAGECGAQVVAVEADPECAAQLEQNMALNHYPVEVHQVAASDRDGVVRFTDGLDTMNRMAAPGTGDREVRTGRLDDLVGKRTVAGLKIDVEGAERLVLRGARRLLDAGVRLIQLEWNETAHDNFGEDRADTYDLLIDAGYTFFRPHQGSLRPIQGCPPLGSDVFARRV